MQYNTPKTVLCDQTWRAISQLPSPCVRARQSRATWNHFCDHASCPTHDYASPRGAKSSLCCPLTWWQRWNTCIGNKTPSSKCYLNLNDTCRTQVHSALVLCFAIKFRFDDVIGSNVELFTPLKMITPNNL